jgi:signal transduction histidine kinase
MVLFSETLAATIDKGNFERAGQIMERLQVSARQSHKETRLLLYELQAEGPGRNVDLIPNLEERLARVERHAGVRAQIVREGSVENIPREWHEDMFWIAVEALNNALKHAQARHVWVTFRCTSEQVEMEIKDDGVGFDIDKVVSGGLGLGNLRARADMISGKLTIQSEPGEGTKIRFFGNPEGL